MTDDITALLKKLNIEDTGTYKNHFYIVDLEDSNAYAKMYTNLNKYAINTEYPNFEKNTNNNTTKVINYFEIDENNITYNIFLFADFDADEYYVKIGEK